MMDRFTSIFHEEVIFLNEEMKTAKDFERKKMSEEKEQSKDLMEARKRHDRLMKANMTDKEKDYVNHPSKLAQATGLRKATGTEREYVKDYVHSRGLVKTITDKDDNAFNAANKLYSNKKKEERKAHHESFNFDII